MLLLAIFAWTLYYCWNERSYFDYHIEPAWFVQNPVNVVNRKGRKVLDLIPPLLTDLDNNGKQELIAVVSTEIDESDDAVVVDESASYRLQVLDVYRDPNLALNDVYHPRILVGTPLSGSKTSPPIAMAAGTFYASHDLEHSGLAQEAQGMIFLMHENLTVSAYRAQPEQNLLSLDWTVDLVNISSLVSGGLTEAHRHRCPSHYLAKLHYHPQRRAGEESVLLVSMAPVPESAVQTLPCERYAAHTSPDASSSSSSSFKDASNTASDVASTEEETLRVFALSVPDGALQWQFHSGVDDEVEGALAVSLPQQPLSFDLRQQLLHHHHHQQQHHLQQGYHWQLFRASLVQQMPFAWFSDDDETLHTAHFQRPTRLGDVTVRSRPESSGSSSSSSSSSSTGQKTNSMKKAPLQMKKKVSPPSAAQQQKTKQQQRQDGATTDSTTTTSGSSNSINNINKRRKKQSSSSLLKLSLSPLAQLKFSASGRRNVSDAKKRDVDDALRRPETQALKTAATYLHAQQYQHYHASSPVSVDGTSSSSSGIIIRKDNVLILRHSRGLQVLALQTGAPLASLALQPHRVYADVNGDQNLDTFYFPFHAEANAAARTRQSTILDASFEENVEQGDCTAVCLSGLPPTLALFNTTALCGLGMQNRRVASKPITRGSGAGSHKRRGQSRRSRRSRTGHLPPANSAEPHHVPSSLGSIDGLSGGPQSNGSTLSTESAFPPVSYAIPLLIPRATKAGEDMKGRRQGQFENEGELTAVTLSSVGVLTALDQKGDILWQDFNNVSPFPAQRQYPDFIPRLLLFDPFLSDARVGSSDEMKVLMVVQESALLIMSLTGRVLHTLRYPARLVSNVVLTGDNNEDGVIDTIIVMTESAILGYRVEVKSVLYPMFLPLAVLLGIALLVLASKLQLQKLMGGHGEDTNEESWTTWWLKTSRATDSLHLD
jgi:hypothetical protein